MYRMRTAAELRMRESLCGGSTDSGAFTGRCGNAGPSGQKLRRFGVYARRKFCRVMRQVEDRMKSTRERQKGGLLLAFIRGSVILQMLDRLSARIYGSFGSGFFGWLFTGYRSEDSGLLTSWLEGSSLWRLGGRACRFWNRQIENSLIILLVRSGMRRMLRFRLRTFGFFTVTFGAYTAVFSLVRALLAGEDISIPEHPELLFAIGMICLSIPLLLSKVTVAENLYTTTSGLLLLQILGYMPEEVILAGRGSTAGRTSVAFFAGLLCGMLTFFADPWLIMALPVAGIYLYLVLCKPEIGVMSLFFAMPLLPTMVLAVLVIYTFFALALKVLRGKRSIHVEPLDIMVMAFAVILFFGGTVSLSGGSLKPALLFVCLMMGYFQTVWLLRERDWLTRCSAAGVLSASLVALYGVFQYLTGTSVMAEAWVDSEMFESIAGRAVGTLENPNMLGEYLILMIPLAVVMLVGHGEGLRRIPAFVCLGIMGVCLILTWSRGAWLGLIFAAVLFLFIWHRRAMWLLFAGIAAIPLLPYILPASIIQRFTSIGNLSDSSTSYRVNIWRASCDMLRDFGFTGIGIGESAWFRVYPGYAYMGVEAAPHSHNLFLQIWLETGICGLIVFVLILFLLCQSVFTMCRQLRDAKRLAVLDLPCTVENISSGSAYNLLVRKTMSQLRITCAAPLSGLFAVLVQGMTDYAWYNYRVYLMFWLMAGLTAAYARSGRAMLMDPKANEEDRAVLDLPYLAGKQSRKKTVRGEDAAAEEETV